MLIKQIRKFLLFNMYEVNMKKKNIMNSNQCIMAALQNVNRQDNKTVNATLPHSVLL